MNHAVRNYPALGPTTVYLTTSAAQSKGMAVCCRCKGGYYEGIKYYAVGKNVYDVGLSIGYPGKSHIAALEILQWLTSSVAIPVIAGLAVGIAFVVVVSSGLKPAAMMTDLELMDMTGQYPEVMALKDRYQNVVVEIERADRITHVNYIATIEPMESYSDTFFGGPKILAVVVEIDSFAATRLSYVCGSGLTHGGPATLETIKTTDCLETP